LETVVRWTSNQVNHARKKLQEIRSADNSMLRPMPPQRRNARENAAVRRLRAALQITAGCHAAASSKSQFRAAGRFTAAPKAIRFVASVLPILGQLALDELAVDVTLM
jgi:hypothetical protein